jgi:hypothetical protein
MKRALLMQLTWMLNGSNAYTRSMTVCLNCAFTWSSVAEYEVTGSDCAVPG